MVALHHWLRSDEHGRVVVRIASRQISSNTGERHTFESVHVKGPQSMVLFHNSVNDIANDEEKSPKVTTY